MLNPDSSQKGHRPAVNCLRVEEQCHLLNSCAPMVMNSTADHHLKMPVAPAASSENSLISLDRSSLERHGGTVHMLCRLLTYKPWADVSPKKKAVLRQSSNRL